MTAEEFIAATEALVGGGRGWSRRAARLLGVSARTLEAARQGVRPVPAFYADRLRKASEAADRAGGCYTAAVPYFEQASVLLARRGWSRGDVLAAAAAWAALGLADSP